jgi:hypothetical protein
MDVLGAGLITLLNGITAVVDRAFSPAALCILAVIAGVSRLASIDLEELDRRSAKPTVPRH